MRGITGFLLTLIVGVGLIWVGFWWVAETRLQTGFTDWAENQATHGVTISYDSIQRGASMLDAAITIDNFALTLPPGPAGGRASFSLPAVTLRIQALDPLVFHIDLPGKIPVHYGNNFDLLWSAGSSAVTEYLDPSQLFNRSAYPFRGGDFTAGDIDILASGGSLLVLHIDKLSSHAEFDPHAGPGATALATSSAVDGVAVSPLLARIASLPFAGRLTRLDFSGTLSGPFPANLPAELSQIQAVPHDLTEQRKLLMPIIHQWASQGGSGKAALTLAVGPSTLHAAVSLYFDANLQPNGTAALTADHLDQFTAALINSYPALQPGIAQAEARASPYLGNTDQGGQTLDVHLAYGRPGIIVNSQKIADLPPFDWSLAGAASPSRIP